jgi:acyl-CoA synthetase (AMP-forming)/AMP-acid ligase II
MTTQAEHRYDARADEPDALLPSLGEYLSHWAAEQPDETALVYIDYDASKDGVRYEHTWAEYDKRATAIAAKLTQLCEPGDRVAILVHQSDEYAVAFHGILRAGLIAVPLFPPGILGGNDRVGLVMENCKAKVIVTTEKTRDVVQGFLDGWLGHTHPTVIYSDEYKGAAADALADGFVAPKVDAHDVAYLQYTSGSTRAPAGVIISHRNVIVNSRQLVAHHELTRGSSAVSWLPLFHDMGLVLGVACPVVFGGLSTMFDGLAFVQRPRRWLEAMTSSPTPFTAAPNFAYDFTAKRVKPEAFEGLDLSDTGAFGNGAEPVYSETIERFINHFTPVGLKRDHVQPIYGLAEATVFACSPFTGEDPHYTDFDSYQLGLGKAVAPEGEAKVSELVSIGHPGMQEMLIVDADSYTTAPDGQVGEIWLRGPNVARGYWENEELTEEVFRAKLLDDPTPEAGPWLRTGDLGVLVDGWFYITGRIKDLIIVDGRNVYPQDVERTVEQAHPAIGPHRTAAFSVPGDGTENVIIVAEQYRLAENILDQLPEIAAAVKKAISAEHSVSVHDFMLVEQFSVPRTSSAKIARRATRQKYLEGSLPRVGPAPAGAPDHKG